MLRLICRVLWILMYPILKLLEPFIQRWVKPTNQSLVLGAVADLMRGRSELVLENAFLRQQVIVLRREKKTTTAHESGSAIVSLVGALATFLERCLAHRPTRHLEPLAS